jgi:catechol 2,3-dioxygenase-like lactoylglutathione lyase family enzyme
VAAFRYLVEDVDTALTFYVDRLGFSLVEDYGPVVAVSRGELELWLSGPESSAAREYPESDQPAPGGWNRIVLVVDDLDADLARLEQAGVPFRGEVLESAERRWIVVEDPSGNPVELFEER